MNFTFPWPVSQGEWLAWSSAAVTLFLGLMLLFAPRIFHAKPAHRFQRGCSRIDLAAQNALRFGDNLQEQEG